MTPPAAVQQEPELGPNAFAEGEGRYQSGNWGVKGPLRTCIRQRITIKKPKNDGKFRVVFTVIIY
jgi:hypothetical protein